MPALKITLSQARCFLTARLGLVRPYADVAAALGDLGFVQLDPINVCGRMHDLILRNRVVSYGEGDLLRYVHPAHASTSSRTAFEHYLPGRGILVVFPIDFWPVIASVTAHRRARPRNRLWPARALSRQEELIGQRILQELRDRGPLTSDDIEHDGRAITAWGTPGRLVKHVLEALFHRADVLIVGRRDFRRVYALPEQVIPADVRARAQPDLDEVQRELALAVLKQRRLVALPRGDRALVADRINTVRLESGAELHVLTADLPALERVAARGDGDDASVRLLAPLDPLIYDRKVARAVWDFDYTWEVYTPPAKRVRGYYALPVLSRGEIVGHVEPRVVRLTRRLQIVSRRVRRGHVTREAVAELARFLGVRPPS